MTMVVGLVVLNNIEVMIKMGICSVLGLIFVTLKLTGVIAWSWWWVLLPFYGGIALLLAILAAGGMAAAAAIGIKSALKNR
ncbi:putative membrane protein [Klebsiella phage vB_KqP-Goliath]|nr:putative membrane protein [Klebsiella phage vB_KqP-Goliath]CAD5239485.1 putative membrane protein [Klebsiella phage vB_KpP-Yoda]